MPLIDFAPLHSWFYTLMHDKTIQASLHENGFCSSGVENTNTRYMINNSASPQKISYIFISWVNPCSLLHHSFLQVNNSWSLD